MNIRSKLLCKEYQEPAEVTPGTGLLRTDHAQEGRTTQQPSCWRENWSTSQSPLSPQTDSEFSLQVTEVALILIDGCQRIVRQQPVLAGQHGIVSGGIL